MAVPIVCGIETEYGIMVRNAPESNPIAASSTLVSAYVSELADQGRGVGRPHRVGWDFEDEQPANDARGGVNPYSYAPEVESHLVNAVLTNGSRYYVDHAHPELSTPECRTALDALLYDRAGEEILIRSMRAAPKYLPDGQEIVVYKNNSDGKGQSYGCHENYMLSRALPFGRLVRDATAHFVTRQIFCGAGKVGTEVTGIRSDAVTFQISQRADFFEEEIGLETTLKRPIVNTRDEPHADPRKYRRFHVIIGDANMSEVATLLKLGTTAMWMAVIDDDAVDRPMKFAAPDCSVTTDLHRPESVRARADGRWQHHDRARGAVGDLPDVPGARSEPWYGGGRRGVWSADPRPLGTGAERVGDRPDVVGLPDRLDRQVPLDRRVSRASSAAVE